MFRWQQETGHRGQERGQRAIGRRKEKIELCERLVDFCRGMKRATFIVVTYTTSNFAQATHRKNIFATLCILLAYFQIFRGL